MDEKIPVKIEPMHKLEHSFRNLYYCKKCQTYTTLPEEGCLKCGREQLSSFGFMVDKISKQRNRLEIISLLNIFLVVVILGGVLFPMSAPQLVISFLILIICLVGIVIIQKRFKESFRALQIYEMIQAEEQLIKNSLKEDYKQISHQIAEGDYLKAYKNLKSLGTVIKKDYIKTAKIHCLNQFVIRSDMSLEMDDLIISAYDKNLVAYIYEVSKVQRNLIKQPTIEYMIEHEEYILEDFENANAILGNVAGAAIYSKSKLELNKDFIIRYMNDIPKERLLRMEKLIYSNIHYEWDELEKAFDIAFKEMGSSMKGTSYVEI